MLTRVLVVSVALVGCVDDMGTGDLGEADLSLKPDGVGSSCHQAGSCEAVGSRCDGDEVVDCRRLGNGCFKESRTDCAAAGGNCEWSHGAAMCEVPESSTCAPGDVGPDCAEVCGNGIDDDVDGALDCVDDDCATAAACAVEVCYDLLDNDDDGTVDCADRDCLGTVLCPSASCPNVTLGSGLGLDLATQVITARPDHHDGYCSVTGGGDMTFEWVAPSSGCFEFSVTSASFAPALQLQGSCDGPDWVCVGAAASEVGHTARMQWQMQAGQPTVVVVDGVDPAATGSFTLGIMPCW